MYNNNKNENWLHYEIMVVNTKNSVENDMLARGNPIACISLHYGQYCEQMCSVTYCLQPCSVACIIHHHAWKQHGTLATIESSSTHYVLVLSLIVVGKAFIESDGGYKAKEHKLTS